MRDTRSFCKNQTRKRKRSKLATHQPYPSQNFHAAQLPGRPYRSSTGERTIFNGYRSNGFSRTRKAEKYLMPLPMEQSVHVLKLRNSHMSWEEISQVESVMVSAIILGPYRIKPAIKGVETFRPGKVSLDRCDRVLPLL